MPLGRRDPRNALQVVKEIREFASADSGPRGSEVLPEPSPI